MGTPFKGHSVACSVSIGLCIIRLNTRSPLGPGVGHTGHLLKLALPVLQTHNVPPPWNSLSLPRLVPFALFIPQVFMAGLPGARPGAGELRVSQRGPNCPPRCLTNLGERLHNQPDADRIEAMMKRGCRGYKAAGPRLGVQQISR